MVDGLVNIAVFSCTMLRPKATDLELDTTDREGFRILSSSIDFFGQKIIYYYLEWFSLNDHLYII